MPRIETARAGQAEGREHRQRQPREVDPAGARRRLDRTVSDEAVETGKYRNQADGGMDHAEGGEGRGHCRLETLTKKVRCAAKWRHVRASVNLLVLCATWIASWEMVILHRT